MKKYSALLLLPLIVSLSSYALATNDPNMLRMVTCESSWLDWKQNPAMVEQFRNQLRTDFRADGSDGSYLPIAPTELLGLKVSRVYPQSVGMGLGYSVLVDAGFKAVRSALAKQVGKPFESCQKDEGMNSCELGIGPRKTIMLTEASAGKNPQTLVGCYYYYEK